MKIEFIKPNYENIVSLPFAESGIRAGFPSPAQDYIESSIDLNSELIAHPSSTFYGRVVGCSMIDAGIEEGDLIIIDKSLEPHSGDMAVCCIDGEFTLKYIDFEPGKGEMWLRPANDSFPSIRITEDNDFIIWGIVTYTIKKRRR